MSIGALTLPVLSSGWHVDQAITTHQGEDPPRLVVIRFGHGAHPDTIQMDNQLEKIEELVEKWAVIYLCDTDEVTDFKADYELYEESFAVLFFFNNKHMMCDFGTGNNNKLNFGIDDKQELIDIMECIYKGAKKGRGLVPSPKGKHHQGPQCGIPADHFFSTRLFNTIQILIESTNRQEFCVRKSRFTDRLKCGPSLHTHDQAHTD